jgi:hypothetical protein
LTSRALKIEIFSLALSFHIILKNEECSIESHEENHEENHEESHEENHEESHEECSIKLFTTI